jgi:hypothetical protein
MIELQTEFDAGTGTTWFLLPVETDEESADD